MHPLMGGARPHAAQASWHHLERRGLAGDQDEEQSIFRRRSGAGLGHGKPARGPGLPIEPLRPHLHLERGLKGWDQVLELVVGHASVPLIFD
jgi:hypothetical protein